MKCFLGIHVINSTSSVLTLVSNRHLLQSSLSLSLVDNEEMFNEASLNAGKSNYFVCHSSYSMALQWLLQVVGSCSSVARR